MRILSSFFAGLLLFGVSMKAPAQTNCDNPHSSISRFFQFVEKGERTNILAHLKGNVVAYDARNEHCETPLHVTIRNNDMETFNLLYNQFRRPDLNRVLPNPKLRESDGDHLGLITTSGTLYNYALVFGDANTLNHLEGLGGEFSSVQFTIYHHLGSEKKVKTAVLAHNQSRHARVLLNRHIRAENVDINHYRDDPNRLSYSVMHVASQSAPTEQLMYLIRSHGGDVNLRNDHDITPLMMAAQSSHTEMARENAKLLIEMGADHIDNHRHETPLMFLAAYGATDVIEALAQRGEDMNYRSTSDQRSPVVWAIKAEQFDAVRTLVKWGASLTHVDEFNTDSTPFAKMPYDFAKSDEMRDLLIRLGAFPTE